MKAFTVHSCISISSLLLLLVSFSCARELGSKSINEQSKKQIILSANKTKVDTIPKSRSIYDLGENLILETFYLDTVIAKSSSELLSLIQSNRVIQLEDKTYLFDALAEQYPIKIEGIINFKLVGKENTVLKSKGVNNCVMQIKNVNNIQIENIDLGQSNSDLSFCNSGKLNITDGNGVVLSNMKIFSKGSIGLVTKDLYNFQFINSEITESNVLIFELEKSKYCRFINSRFYENHLGTSVLGGFTNGTKNVSFENCEFVNNVPSRTGNPAFNFFENYKNIEDRILFRNSTFKNNRGFKWYGEKIELENCKIDSSDFIGLSRLNK